MHARIDLVEDGQVLLESAIGLGIAIAVCTLAFAYLTTEWQQTRCLYTVFTATHGKLVGSPSAAFLHAVAASTRISETPETVRGQSTCGKFHEDVELPKLEKAAWR